MAILKLLPALALVLGLAQGAWAEEAAPPAPSTEVQGLTVATPDPKDIHPCKGDDEACIKRLVQLARIYAPKEVKAMCGRMASNRLAEHLMRDQLQIGDDHVPVVIQPNPLEKVLCLSGK